jgi:SAM-dependent methyltransferase
MNAGIARLVACPVCARGLALQIERERDGKVIEGRFRCHGCERDYPVRGGIPQFLPDRPAGEAMTTAERFGYEWTRFSEILSQYEAQFLAWIAPAGPGDFAGRIVLDAGCGKGRHLRLAAQFGAAEVIGVDLGPAVEAAVRNTADLPNVFVFKADLLHLPIAPASVDLVYSVGVLHHLPDPFAGFRALIRVLKPGGRIVLWVYGREGNGWIVTFVNPVRRITSRLSLPFLRVFSAWVAFPLWLALQGIYRPAHRAPSLAWLQRWLPYQAYLKDLTGFPFREIHAITFDHLLAPIAHYVREGEVAKWFADCGLKLDSLRWHHRNSWSAIGYVPGRDESRIAGTGRAQAVSSIGHVISGSDEGDVER